jgi:peptidoglycan hydrolase-like amidase
MAADKEEPPLRIAPAMLAIFASLIAYPFAVPAASVEAKHAGHCTEWRSRSEPPPTIRVYRVSEGFVEEVDFKLYVMRVASREWGVKQGELRQAGAVAVKQYAWYHILHHRGGEFEGQCFDVRDNTSDQLYGSRPIKDIPRKIKRAVNKTWTWRLWRDDKFIMTGYRRGEWLDCAEDAGKKLRARSAKKCANAGWNAERLLQVYYTARLVK